MLFLHLAPMCAFFSVLVGKHTICCLLFVGHMSWVGVAHVILLFLVVFDYRTMPPVSYLRNEYIPSWVSEMDIFFFTDEIHFHSLFPISIRVGI